MRRLVLMGLFGTVASAILQYLNYDISLPVLENIGNKITSGEEEV